MGTDIFFTGKQGYQGPYNGGKTLKNTKLASPYSWPRCAGGVPEILMTDLNIIRADVDLSLLAPGRALIDNHPLLRPLELVGESYGHNLNISP